MCRPRRLDALQQLPERLEVGLADLDRPRRLTAAAVGLDCALEHAGSRHPRCPGHRRLASRDLTGGEHPPQEPTQHDQQEQLQQQPEEAAETHAAMKQAAAEQHAADASTQQPAH